MYIFLQLFFVMSVMFLCGRFVYLEIQNRILNAKVKELQTQVIDLQSLLIEDKPTKKVLYG